MTELLQSPFVAGSLNWVKTGPALLPERASDRLKISVLLGNTTGRASGLCR